MAKRHVPYIAASKNLPELTVKGIILGILLSIILGAANIYLGLRVGLTVSASIPAAVMSMAVLRLFKKHNILENNAVQTAASAGESLAAGIIFTIPALVLLGFWEEVHFWETTLIAVLGGVLGVLFTVPLRRALIVEAELLFPEGIATSEVLKTGEKGSVGLMALAIGGGIGLLFKFLQSAAEMFTHTALAAKRTGQTIVGFGSDLSPALLGVGYIVGLQIASLVFLGGIIGWLIGIPLYSAFADSTIINGTDWSQLSPGSAAGFIWSTRIRYMGVGAMLVGGLWSLVSLRKPLGQAVAEGWNALRGNQATTPGRVPRTEREFGMGPTMFATMGMVVPMFLLYWWISRDLGFLHSLGVALVMALIMIVAGFVFSAVAAYMAGTVGSSNNPISGVTILTVLVSAFALLALGAGSTLGPALTIMIAGVIACAAAIGGDNMQDLKAGYLLGATPRRQQIMQIIGVGALALVAAPVLKLLDTAWGFGSAQLAAPQAGLMAAVADFVFNGGLPVGMIATGAGIAVALIILDKILAAKGARFRTPVMPVAVGIYLPVGLSAPIFIGGVVAYMTGRRFDLWRYRNMGGLTKTWWTKAKDMGHKNGILFASGLIAGEAILGIFLALLLVTIGLEVSPGVFRLPFSLGLTHMQWPGLILFGYVILMMIYLALRPGLVRNRDEQA